MSAREPASPALVELINALRAEGLSIRQIAKRTQTAASSVHWILTHPQKRPDREQARPAQRHEEPPEPQALPVPLARPRKAESGPEGVPSWLAGAHPLRPEEPGSHPADRDLPGWRRRRPGGPW